MEQEDRAAILDELALADQMRARAIDRLAGLAPEPGSGFLVPAEIHNLLRRCQSRFAASEGYQGHGLGWKHKDGQATSTQAVIVLVRHKMSKRELRRANGKPAPRWLFTSDGKKIATDVVEFGVTPRLPIRSRRTTVARDDSQSLLVKRMAATLQPGASIGPSDFDNPGTLACFARTSLHQFVGVTAGHVAKGGAGYVTPSGSGQVFGFLDRSQLSPVDVATIFVSSGWSKFLPNGSRIIGWRQLTGYDIGRTKVSLYGAQSGSWSTGTVECLAQWIENWELEDAIVYTSPSLSGDSGGPVIDDAGYLVGIHVGRGMFQGKSVAIANSMARVVSELSISPVF